MSAVPGSCPDFRLAVRFADPAVVALAGELDVASAPELAAVLDALIGRGHDQLIVECDELSFIDASGLGALVAAQAQLGATAGEIRVQGLSAFAYRIFEVTGLVEVLHARRHNPSSRAAVNDGRDTDRLASQAAHLVAESARADVLSALLSLAPRIIVNCDGASLTLRRGEHLLTAAASDETVQHLDGIQYANRDGPCVDATDEGVQIHAPKLVEERRWHAFTTQAREHGMESVLSSPLTAAGDQPNGALNLYSRTPSGFLAADRELASDYATLIAPLVPQSDETTTAHQLEYRIRDTLDSRDLIARSQGILMERLGLDADDAFTTLRRDSVRTSIPLRARARDIVEETQNPAVPPDQGPPNE